MENSNPLTRFAENIARMRANAEGPFTGPTTNADTHDFPVGTKVCVVCGQPIEPAPTDSAMALDESGAYVHVTYCGQAHRAQPKLAHPMDDDPFAGIE